ncbi:MAG TPA: YetF domain-containing protein [Chryseolinea sp.]
MFDWQRILLNDAPLDFLLEVMLRSVIMFLTLVIVLKIAGKRGVKQLSIFEMVIIISLGSAAGDPMFYEDVAIVHALVVFLVVLILYRLITWATGKSRWVEKFLEGETECLVDEGKFSLRKFEKESLAQDEFFTELRLRNVDHLGQVKKAYLETSGEVSVFFYADDDVKAGLPILPELFGKQLSVISKAGQYCCCKCGELHELSPGTHSCPICNGTHWVLPIQTKRIT